MDGLDGGSADRSTRIGNGMVGMINATLERLRAIAMAGRQMWGSNATIVTVMSVATGSSRFRRLQMTLNFGTVAQVASRDRT